jgi:hypothetical protein
VPDDGPGQAHRHSHPQPAPYHRVPAQLHRRPPATTRIAHCPSDDAFTVSRAAEVVITGQEEFLAMFEGVVCGDYARCDKPDPVFFLQADAVLGVPSLFYGALCPGPKSE